MYGYGRSSIFEGILLIEPKEKENSRDVELIIPSWEIINLDGKRASCASIKLIPEKELQDHYFYHFLIYQGAYCLPYKFIEIITECNPNHRLYGIFIPQMNGYASSNVLIMWEGIPIEAEREYLQLANHLLIKTPSLKVCLSDIKDSLISLLSSLQIKKMKLPKFLYLEILKKLEAMGDLVILPLENKFSNIYKEFLQEASFEFFFFFIYLLLKIFFFKKEKF